MSVTAKHPFQASLGPTALEPGRWRFRVWAPRAERVDLHLLEPDDKIQPMEPERRGYWSVVVEELYPGALYKYRLDDETERPDPASRHQPRGVHGPSQLVPTDFEWSETEWKGLPLREHIFYELHVGAFTEKGTFEGVIDRLDYLERLGVTAVELMPIAQFPGERNWGYDGAYPYAAQNSYGGPLGFKELVDACHERGLAVVLDVVYNHMGPEGCYLSDFGPYFTEQYRTPWGRAINFDGPGSDEVRRFFIENALYWVSECRVDALRLDAIHGIVDPSALPFLEELAQAVHHEANRQGRQVHLIAENDRNDPRIIQAPEKCGHDLDGLWNDDFHHALHSLLTEERTGYYRDFGALQHMEKALREGFVHSGEYSNYRQRRHGRSSKGVSPDRMVVFAQNHDQVGNRAQGERLTDLVNLERLKLGAATTILSPYLPLLFMGEEYGELSPFLYFVHHSDEDLVEAVRAGRRKDFQDFDWPVEVPDPQSADTFLESRIDHERREEGWHRALFGFYRRLLTLRRTLPGLTRPDRRSIDVQSAASQRLVALHRRDPEGDFFLYLHFSAENHPPAIVPPVGSWKTLIDSSAEEWGGPGNGVPERVESDDEQLSHRLPPWSAVLLRHVPHGETSTGDRA
ncbi:MAG: malto-oligosyltrehalose trehalohydrolase [Gemmatimonadota bacterium]